MGPLTLKQKRELDRAKEILVPAAEALLRASEIMEIRPNDFGDSQIRNLIAVAHETDSPAVVTNFIKYLMGKDSHGKSWARGDLGARLGDRFIREIDQGAVLEAVGKIPDLAEDSMQYQLARIELTRHFLGFVSRYLKYINLERNPSRQSA